MWIENLIESWCLATESLMASGSWWRRTLGFALAIVALWCLVALTGLWLLIGKKPPRE